MNEKAILENLACLMREAADIAEKFAACFEEESSEGDEDTILKDFLFCMFKIQCLASQLNE